MREIDIRSRCKVNSNYEMDTFVGLQCKEGDFGINFPMGYHISENDTELRKDILLLLHTLSANTERKESEILGKVERFDKVDFPFQSYMFVIKDYYVRGYYKEQEIIHRNAKFGKINWNRTNKTQKPYTQGTDVFYLDFVTKKNSIKEDELITLIHQHCVYESFKQIGWLFTESLLQKPAIKKNTKLFRTVLKNKIASTFNDQNRYLFRHMLAIVDFEGDIHADKNYRYGTYRFEYVWEKIIDRIFGINNKAEYFPKTSWHLLTGKSDNAPLEPDTIMVYENNVYILDAKYYKFGITGRIWDLPGTSSISKQITYGEYVANNKKFKDMHGNAMKVFNAFLMPFDSSKNSCDEKMNMKKIGIGLSDWKDNSEEYQKVQGILIDVKTLLSINMRQEMYAIEQLVQVINNL